MNNEIPVVTMSELAWENYQERAFKTCLQLTVSPSEMAGKFLFDFKKLLTYNKTSVIL